jgi:peptide chain release factor 3
VGYGSEFEGVYDLKNKELHRYTKVEHGAYVAEADVTDLATGLAKSRINHGDKSELLEIVELIGDEFAEMDMADFFSGKVSPVFFGSALNNFGLDLFLSHFSGLAPSPQAYVADTGKERGIGEGFSGFIFKMQANMNPDHRDCTAFVRIASGKFRKGMEVLLSDSGKKVKLSTPHSLMGDEREMLEEAYPGDILALFNPGNFRIGGTLSEKESVRFDVIPLFSPEHFMKASSKDPFKRKQLREGLQQLSEEGVVHVFEVPNGVGNELLLGTVGALQFDVVKHRMMSEYNVEITLSPVPYHTARWLPKDDAVIGKLSKSYSTAVTFDLDGNPIVLFDSAYALNQATEAVGAGNLYKYKSG